MVAVADALRAEADVRVVYVGTARGIEARVVPARGDELELLDVQPIKGRGVFAQHHGGTCAGPQNLHVSAEFEGDWSQLEIQVGTIELEGRLVVMIAGLDP